MPKISMKDFGGNRISKTCVMLGVGLANMVLDSLNFDADAISSIANSDAPQFTRMAINHVLGWTGNTNVASPVVKTVPINVIDVPRVPRNQPKNLTVHQDANYFFANASTSDCIPFVPCFKGCPLVIPQQVIIGICKGDFPFGQGDFTVRLFRGCHSLSNQRLGFGGTINPDTLSISQFAIQGGQEFQESIMLHQRFIKYAMDTNKRLAMSGIFPTDLRRTISKEDEAQPRFALEGAKQ